MDRALWDMVRPATITRHFEELAIADGFQRGRLYAVGIDIGNWFYDIHAAYRPEAIRGVNPELRVLFYRLARLCALPIRPVFVFDGADRSMARRGRYSLQDDEFVARLKTLLGTFGFAWHIAPACAAAELARMNKDGVIDGVITDDFEVLAYGAKTLIQPSLYCTTRPFANPFVRVLTIDSIASNPAVRLRRGGVILLTILRCGNGNTTFGINGARPSIAIALALARTRLGEALIEAAARPHAEVITCLDIWREDFKAELRTNISGSVASEGSKLADRITDQFPNLGALKAILEPPTSWTTGLAMAPEIADRLALDLAALAEFCGEHFEFGTINAIMTKILSVLSRGIVMDMLLQQISEGVLSGVPVFDILQILKTRLHTSTSYFEYRVEINTCDLPEIVQARAGDPSPELPGNAAPALSIFVWVPGPVLFAAFPALVNDFHKHNGTSRTPRDGDAIDLTESDSESETSDVELLGGNIINLVSDSDSNSE
ncbi:PIN domain-like protein [Rickenella mellea]|uniref:PIN domain-like protein n=1 Tax=Rickenella mellea TaxID=50990 RepID=A0A4Y7PNG6_9AGAM|nr:PIN domain-like protein [Rickenella mellea]